MKAIYFIVLCIILFSCTTSNEKRAWEIANYSQTNKEELIRFLEYYKKYGDKEKYKAACFLIKNIPNKYSLNGKGQKIYDIDIIKADSLIQSLEYSFHLKDNSPYLTNYTFEQFCEYILPYRVANEPLQYYWKWDCNKRYNYKNLLDIAKAAQCINAQIKLELSPEFYKDTLKAYSTLIHMGYGKCDDRTTLVVMALRSAGIPAAFEFVPYWGSSNNGHSFASIILPDNKIFPLLNSDKKTDKDYYLARKTPKIYRKTYAIQKHLEYTDDVPNLFKNNDISDVTNLHKIGVCDYITSTKKYNKEGINYLSVFSPKGWIPVASSSSSTFYNIGNGIRYEVDNNMEAVDLGKGILYLPIRWINTDAIPIGNPIIISEDSIREIEPDIRNHERVILKRKYPLNLRIIEFSKLMIMGIFEGANKADFSDAEELIKITKIPKSQMQSVNVISDKRFRYIRYKRPKGTLSIAEFSLFNKDGIPIPFRPIACEAIRDDSLMINIFDNNPLTYYQISGGVDMWVGADMHKSVNVGSIRFAPRNDDNAVNSTDYYELFYWNDKWNSLGIKKSTNDSIVFDNVPKDALLWLHDITKGHEERPFTYENGKQIWW